MLLLLLKPTWIQRPVPSGSQEWQARDSERPPRGVLALQDAAMDLLRLVWAGRHLMEAAVASSAPTAGVGDCPKHEHALGVEYALHSKVKQGEPSPPRLPRFCRL